MSGSGWDEATGRDTVRGICCTGNEPSSQQCGPIEMEMGRRGTDDSANSPRSEDQEWAISR